MPGCMASSTRRTFSATDQRRRRCTEVMTSTLLNGTSEALDIVFLIGVCLCLIGYAACPVKMGCAPISRLFQEDWTREVVNAPTRLTRI
jgi:hypothetical protein